MDDRSAARALSALERYRDGPPKHPRSYPDLHEHVLALARAGLLVVVDEPINKDTEMHPLVRWQYRGGIAGGRAQGVPVHAADRLARAAASTSRCWSRGSRPTATSTASASASRSTRSAGPGSTRSPIRSRRAWSTDAPCQEIVITGADLDSDGAALDGLPVPISTPGFDNAPYLSAGHYITKDPDTGIQNVGNYRGQLKAPRRLGMNPSVELRAGIYAHWEKCKARGEPLPCAVVVGCPPAVSYASVQKMPENLDEIAVAGALAGGPINVVRAKTVDLLVPAEAEIVIEGLIDTEALEPEAPFGESHGYVNLQEYNAFMDGDRDHAPAPSDPHLVHQPGDAERIERDPPRGDGAGLSPSPQVGARHQGREAGGDARAAHQPLCGDRDPVRARRRRRREIWRALHGASALHRFAGKWIVAVDEDIEPDNADALFWAMSYRCQPQHDLAGRSAQGPRPRAARPARRRRERGRADQRHAQGHLRAGRAAQARIHGERQGDLGAARAAAADAAAAVARLRSRPLAGRSSRARPRWRRSSEYFELGRNLANERRSDVAMNTPVAMTRMAIANSDARLLASLFHHSQRRTK